MIGLKKIWAWVKVYWYIPLMLLVSLVAALVFKSKNTVDWDDILNKARESHAKEVDVIENAHKKEIEKRDMAFRRMEDAKYKIEKEYKTRLKEIDRKKEKEINRILKKTKDSPSKMAEELASATGYKIVVLE